MSNTLDITTDQGSTLDYTFSIKNTSNAAVNLTGFDARLQVRRTYGDTTILINCTLANGKLAFVDATNGTIKLLLAPADTSSIRFNNKDDDSLDCVYDLELITPTSTVYKPARGAFTLNREVTR